MEIIFLIILAVAVVGLLIAAGLFYNFAFFGGVWKGEKTTSDRIVLAIIVVLAIALMVSVLI